jgi:hypothetical protein
MLLEHWSAPEFNSGNASKSGSGQIRKGAGASTVSFLAVQFVVFCARASEFSFAKAGRRRRKMPLAAKFGLEE